jgi:hypothetical protein
MVGPVVPNRLDSILLLCQAGSLAGLAAALPELDGEARDALQHSANCGDWGEASWWSQGEP